MLMKLSLFCFLIVTSLILSGCVGGSNSNDASTSITDQNYFQVSSLQPTITIYGVDSESIVTSSKFFSVNGAIASPSLKKLTLTVKINGGNHEYTLGDNGIFQAPLVLIDGTNTVDFSVSEDGGFVVNRYLKIIYQKDSKINSDISLSATDFISGETTDLVSEIGFSDASDILKVDLFSRKTSALVTSMLDDGSLPDEIKSDGVYTTKFSYLADIGSNCFYAVVTKKSGGQYQSSTICGDGYKKQTNESINRSAAVGQSIAYLMNADKTDRSPVEKASDVVKKLKSNSNYADTFKSLNYDADGSIFWTTKDGMNGIHWRSSGDDSQTGEK